jgi:hypothetical protein
MQDSIGMAVLALALASLGGCTHRGGLGNDEGDDGRQRRQLQYLAALEQARQYRLGSRRNPVRVGSPREQHDYLSRLRCKGDRTPEYRYVRVEGELTPWGHEMDRYAVSCPDGRSTTVFMDTHHSDHIEDQAISGFTLAPAPR